VLLTSAFPCGPALRAQEATVFAAAVAQAFHAELQSIQLLAPPQDEGEGEMGLLLAAVAAQEPQGEQLVACMRQDIRSRQRELPPPLEDARKAAGNVLRRPSAQEFIRWSQDGGGTPCVGAESIEYTPPSWMQRLDAATTGKESGEYNVFGSGEGDVVSSVVDASRASRVGRGENSDSQALHACDDLAAKREGTKGAAGNSHARRAGLVCLGLKTSLTRALTKIAGAGPPASTSARGASARMWARRATGQGRALRSQSDTAMQCTADKATQVHP